jgi:iron complex outermembrane recepter protein
MFRSIQACALAASAIAPYTFSAQPTAAHDALEEIVVTATPLRSHPLETAQPVTVVSGEDLRRHVGVSLGDTLAHTPGVSASHYGPIASRPIIRGLGGYRVQMLDDGLTSMDASNLSDDHAVSLDASLARQIEILRGPAALLYGSGGAGGAVNVVSSRLPEQLPASPLRAVLELRGDTPLKERSATGEVGANAGAFAWHADGYLRSTGDQRAANFTVSNSASDSWGVSSGATYFGNNGFLGISLNHFDTQYGLPAEERAFIALRQNRVDLKGRLEFTGGPFTALTARAGHNNYGHTEFEQPGVPGTVFDNDQHEIRTTLERIVPSGARTILGLQYGSQKFAAIGDEAFVPTSTTRTIGVFAVDERDYSRLTVQVGGRLDHQRIEPDAQSNRTKYGATALSLSAGGLWKFTEVDAVALNITRTQRHPQATELYADGFHAALQRYELGSESLYKETGYTVDLALRRVADVRWDAGVFFNRYDKFVFVESTGAVDGEHGVPVFAYVQADADLYGVEAQFVAPMPWFTQESLQMRLFGDLQRGELRNGGSLPAIPAFRLGLGLDYDITSWHLGLELVRNGRQSHISPNETPTDGFTLMNIEASYRLEFEHLKLLIFGRGSNLFNVDARLHASPLKDIVPLPGRGLRVGLRLEY